ncbi:phospholipase D-like domain-containing protein [uncultured Nocardioides sp.]|uniref:phospholipase D-like domain-containing protein n=1 Tax=uncultured Nocardioides sp. TaxID=198441 RepID=UPI002633B567|nr:phospholipase D-like domain-containing protein [uncultured Nocardioides sp.]
MLKSSLGSRSPRRLVSLLTVAVSMSVVAGLTVGAPVASSASGEVVAAAPTASQVRSAPETNAKRYMPKEGAHFNTPREGARQYVIEREVLGAINHAIKGTAIRMSMFSFDRMVVADALVRAKRRGVSVKVLVNNHEMTAAQAKLRSVLGNNRNKKNWWFQCKSACRGQGDVNHSKFILFRKAGGANYTTMVGSMNMKQNGTDNQFNDLFVENGQKPLFTFYNRIFNEMAKDKNAKPMYVKKTFGDGKFWVHILPFPKAPLGTPKTRYTVARDPMNQILRPIKCRNARTPSGRTAVRVNMHAWDGTRGTMLANRFRDLYAQGCDVKILVGFAGEKVRRVFANRTKRGYVPVRSTGFDTNGDRMIDKYSHEKTLMVNGNYGKKRGDKFIVTGSANHQDGGQYGDEIIMRVRGPRLHSQYVNNWNVKWNRYSHGFSWGAAGMPRASGPAILGWNGLGTDSPEWEDE